MNGLILLQGILGFSGFDLQDHDQSPPLLTDIY